MGDSRKHSCKTATETLEWINSIIDFFRPYRHLLDAHVVNFFKDRLWETIDKQWMDCLRVEPIENLLKLPSGVVQDHWPASLKNFVLTLRSLVLPRGQESLSTIVPGVQESSISTVLAQGMNLKKKHEVEILAAIVNSIAVNAEAQTIVDVGAGQGYLAQVLSFQYQLPVVAIDASYHHGTVTSARAERIRKHFAAKIHKSQATDRQLNVPRTVACRVLSSDMLKSLSDIISHEDRFKQPRGIEATLREAFVEGIEVDKVNPLPCDNLGMKSFKQPHGTEATLGEPFLEGLEVDRVKSLPCDNLHMKTSLVLAGLHACGDLSVTMLRTFLECKEVKAVVSIGCCYNLLSEEGLDNCSCQCGFPMSCGVSLTGLSLGRSARDLACQCAERWKVLTKDGAVQNFESHAFRAAFQMVLHRYHPEILKGSPSIGRQGKALRRQQVRKAIEDHLKVEESTSSSVTSPLERCVLERSCSIQKSMEVGTQDSINDIALGDGNLSSTIGTDAPPLETPSSHCTTFPGIQPFDRYSLFQSYCDSGFLRLGLIPSEGIDFLQLWTESYPFAAHIGPYWSLRAALGPLVETLLLLDRLLFLQEKGRSVDAVLLPIFDPTLSPRNVALIAQKIDKDLLYIGNTNVARSLYASPTVPHITLIGHGWHCWIANLFSNTDQQFGCNQCILEESGVNAF